MEQNRAKQIFDIQQKVSLTETKVNFRDQLSITLSGRLELKDIRINNSLLFQKPEFIEKVFTKVFNSALTEAKRVHQEVVTEGLLSLQS